MGIRDRVAMLLMALKDMQSSLVKVVGDVRGNAESVATASAQISQGNTDLSQRTEEQASALQQTAATMEELGTTVKQNADNAQPVSYTHLRAHETVLDLVCRLLLAKKKDNSSKTP